MIIERQINFISCDFKVSNSLKRNKLQLSANVITSYPTLDVNSKCIDRRSVTDIKRTKYNEPHKEKHNMKSYMQNSLKLVQYK